MKFDQTKHIQLSQNHMATTFRFKVRCLPSDLPRADQVLLEAHQRVTQLEQELSEFIEDSPVYRFNQSRDEVIAVPESVIFLLEQARKISRQTQSAFSVFAKSPGFDSVLGRTDDDWIGWDPIAQTIWKKQPEAHLSFGAIGKGYALDCVRTQLEQAGFQDFFLNAGGSSMILSGFASDGQPWPWAWSWEKDQEGDPVGVEFFHQTGEPIALGVSGLHEKGEHLIGLPASQRLKSSLIASRSAAEADALSTALLVSGWSKGQPQMESPTSQPATAAVDHQGIAIWNGIFERLWGVAASLFFAMSSFAEEEVLDLEAMMEGQSSFTPYIFERNGWWAILPLALIAIVAVHLKKTKPIRSPQILAKRSVMQETKKI